MQHNCPRFDILSQFADATLSEDKVEEVLAHLSSCETCSEKVETLEHSPKDRIVASLRDLQTQPIDHDDPRLPARIAQYEILEKLGQGGMGTVYRAVQPHLERDVAIKVVNESRLTDPAARERFKREIQAVGKLRHPHIVQAYDAGFDHDRPYLVMEFLRGIDLSEYVKRYGKLGVPTACDYIRQAALGLQHAHEAGIVHRDIKPSNLFLTRDGTIKILDLGLATLLDAEEQPISWRNIDPETAKTMTGQILGSLDFLSPEQALGIKAESSSDIYSLGCAFYYLLSGRLPLENEKYRTVQDKLTGHIRDEFPPLRIPRKTNATLRKMVAKTPANRFTSAKEVAEVLETRRTFLSILFSLLMAVAATVFAYAANMQSDKAEIFFNHGVKYYEENNYHAAIDLMTEAIRRRPNFPEAYFNRASSYGNLNDHESAVADYSEVIRLQPDRAAAYYYRAINLERLGRIDEAISDLNEAVRLNPHDGFSFINRAELYRRQGQLDLALENINQAIRLEPHVADAYNHRGLIHKDRGDISNALKDLNTAIHYEPTLAQPYINRGWIYLESGEYPKALRDLEEAIKLDPNEPMAFNNYGMCKIQLGEMEEALKNFDEALRLAPTFAMAYNNRGYVNTCLQNWDQADSDLTKAIELDPNQMHAYHNKGRLLLLKEDYSAAADCLTKAIELNPDYELAYVLRALAYCHSGNKKLAMADLSRDLDPLAMNPKTLYDIYLCRAETYEMMNEKDKADVNYDRAEKLKQYLDSP